MRSVDGVILGVILGWRRGARGHHATPARRAKVMAKGRSTIRAAGGTMRDKLPALIVVGLGLLIAFSHTEPKIRLRVWTAGF